MTLPLIEKYRAKNFSEIKGQDIPIEEIIGKQRYVSVKARRMCKTLGIKVSGDFLKFTRKELSAAPGVHEKTLDYVVACLSGLGIKLKIGRSPYFKN